MTYTEFVSQPCVLWKRMLHKRDEIDKMEAICMKSTTELKERVQGSSENITEKNYLALCELRTELNALLSEYQVAKDEVRNFIYANLDHDSADILEWKYVDHKSAREIALIIGVEEQTARNKLSKLEKICRKTYTEYKKV